MFGRKLKRRKLLQGLGAGALGLPFLGSIPGAAEDSEFPQRFVVFYTPNEPIDRDHWLPSGAGDEFALPAALPDMMRSLDDYRSRLLMIGDTRMVTRQKDEHGGGHVGIGHMLTGEINIPYGEDSSDFWAGGISVDQYIADRLGVDALTLAARPGGSNGNCRMSYRAASEPVHPFEDPAEAFDSIFGNFEIPEDELATMRAQKQSVLDSIASDVARLQPQLGADDRHKLDRHLDAVRAIEDKLGEDLVLSCTDPKAPAGGYDPGSSSDFPVTSRRQMDVLVETLACDATRVATLQQGNTGGAENFSSSIDWASEGIEFPFSQHVIAHNYNDDQNAQNTADRVKLETFLFDQFAYFLDRLDSVPEGDGTLLDHTLVLWTKNIGRNHSGYPMLYMLAGGAPGLETNRFISRDEVPHNNLLVTICHLMGLDDVETFGDKEICTGALAL